MLFERNVLRHMFIFSRSPARQTDMSLVEENEPVLAKAKADLAEVVAAEAEAAGEED